MNVRFFLNSYGQMAAEMDGQREVMIAAKFNQRENQAKASEYLRGVARKMTELHSSGEVAAAADLLQEAESKISKAQTAESFMEEVAF